MELFKKEQKITLSFQKGDKLVEMTCVIDNVYDDRLEITLPQYFMRYIEYLQENAILTAKVFTRLGTIDFSTVVILSPLEESFFIELDYNSIKLTSGNELPVIKAIENLELEFNNSKILVKTFEISTEYIKFNYNNDIELETELRGYIKLPKDYGIIKFNGILSERDDIYENEYTVSYTMMSEIDKQDLLYYMYMYTKNSD